MACASAVGSAGSNSSPARPTASGSAPRSAAITASGGYRLDRRHPEAFVVRWHDQRQSAVDVLPACAVHAAEQVHGSDIRDPLTRRRSPPPGGMAPAVEPAGAPPRAAAEPLARRAADILACSSALKKRRAVGRPSSRRGHAGAPAGRRDLGRVHVQPALTAGRVRDRMMWSNAILGEPACSCAPDSAFVRSVVEEIQIRYRDDAAARRVESAAVACVHDV